MVGDREWFEARPDARHRCRPITAAERVEFGGMAGVKLSSRSVIHVAQIKPGVRQRVLYVPGTEAVPDGTPGFFGHRSTFELLEAANEPLPETWRGVLASGLEVALFALPPNISPESVRPDVHGLVVLLPGDGLPVPFS